jgi:hypothetical protein
VITAVNTANRTVDRVRRAPLTLVILACLVAGLVSVPVLSRAVPTANSWETLLAQNIAAECEPQSAGVLGYNKCVALRTLDMAAQSGLETAVLSLEELSNVDPVLKVNCHDVMHSVGVGAWERFGPSALDSRRLWFCDLGYYHGAMTVAVHDMTMVEFLESISGVCNQLEGAGSQQQQTNRRNFCFHGIGHALVEAGRPSDALFDDCANTPQPLDCVSGAVMQSWESGAFRTASSLSAVVGFCEPAQNLLEGQAANRCLLEMVRLYINWNQGRDKEAKEYCDQLGTDTASVCRWGLGLGLGVRAGQYLLDDKVPELMNQVNELCGDADCAAGFGFGVTVGTRSVDDANEFCALLRKHVQSCRSTVGSLDYRF